MSRTKKNSVVAAKPAIHYTENYIINPAHPITINLIGVGGTGSQVLTSLARMNSALKSLGHTGLHVTAIDPDRVTAANMGRQLFSTADIDEYKCMCLITRANRFFGTEWDALPSYYNKSVRPANITISCVDTGKARTEIKANLLLNVEKYNKMASWAQNREPYTRPYYWMDFGNMKDRGQVVLGTLQNIPQPADSANIDVLPTVDMLHPDIMKDNKKDDQGPSCSLAEALGKQDLFINTNLANMGMAILWKMFREASIKYHGCYMNLETLSVNPIKVK